MRTARSAADPCGPGPENKCSLSVFYRHHSQLVCIVGISYVYIDASFCILGVEIFLFLHPILTAQLDV